MNNEVQRIFEELNQSYKRVNEMMDIRFELYSQGLHDFALNKAIKDEIELEQDLNDKLLSLYS